MHARLAGCGHTSPIDVVGMAFQGASRVRFGWGVKRSRCGLALPPGGHLCRCVHRLLEKTVSAVRAWTLKRSRHQGGVEGGVEGGGRCGRFPVRSGKPNTFATSSRNQRSSARSVLPGSGFCCIQATARS